MRISSTARFASVLLAAVSLWACSSNPSPETPPAAEPGGDPAAEKPAEAPPSEPAPTPVAKRTGDNSVPDDYQVTDGDCVQLGRQYGAVTKADLQAQLSPKLSAKQRAATEKSFDAAAAKMEAQALETCRKSMAGKSADPKALKCALGAASAKAFDQCLNGEGAGASKK
jgi:hypothetical protein